VFDICPICKASVRVRLLDDWRERSQRGEPIPIVGCGNPWHYQGVVDVRADAPLLDAGTARAKASPA
jgi:hypothetical protein